MAKKYRVTLTALEREELAVLLWRGRADVRKLKHAQVRLPADAGEAAAGAGGGPGWCDTWIAEAVRVGRAGGAPGRLGLRHAAGGAGALDAAAAGQLDGRAAARRCGVARDRAAGA